LWSLRAVGGPCAAGSLENGHLRGRSAPVWHESATDNRRLKTGKKFLVYVEQCLAPTLKPKHIVIIDNLPAHEAIGDRVAIEARGATFRYLPKNSPDLNSIEMPFAS
jgi:transposase